MAIDNTRTLTILRPADAPAEKIRPEAERWLLHTGNLMAAVLVFSGGPWAEPDPLHTHPHEQISYVAEGEILLIRADREPARLSAGDLFAVPPDVPHAVQLLSPTAKVVDCFTPLRQDFLKQP